MSRQDIETPPSRAASSSEVIHRRWVLSKRADDGRPVLIREDRVVHPAGFAAPPRRSPSAETGRAGGTVVLT